MRRAPGRPRTRANLRSSDSFPTPESIRRRVPLAQGGEEKTVADTDDHRVVDSHGACCMWLWEHAPGTPTSHGRRLPVNLTVYISDTRVSVSPATVGAGPGRLRGDQPVLDGLSRCRRPGRWRRVAGQHGPDQPAGHRAGGGQLRPGRLHGLDLERRQRQRPLQAQPNRGPGRPRARRSVAARVPGGELLTP